ncbi:MAG TPA: acyl-CoA desaturase [Thermoleophilaceae bacterium]|jgi:stearoyl-CoA desaturase (delta-9 desaturase)|nr:acyl-CoA desaturase [Thermoleophilaceae bacterium]
MTSSKPPESVPIEHVWLDRAIQGVATGAPLAALIAAGCLAWGGILHWQDLVVLAIVYLITGLGITVGFHRLFTHRSFKTTRVLRVVFAVLGSMAVEGSLVEWVATHRKHHVFSDQPGDPHSPHVGQAGGVRGAVQGLVHAHVGWLFRSNDRANPARYARDLMNERDLVWVSRAFPLWVVAGLGLAFGLGVALTGSVIGGLTGLLWGGGARIFLLHHATFSINSLCHFFGRRPFGTTDESRNLAWLAPITFGESWHNNHHAFPTSSRHGLGRGQLDLGAWLIDTLERVGLAWDVVRVPAEKQVARQVATAASGQPS